MNNAEAVSAGNEPQIRKQTDKCADLSRCRCRKGGHEARYGVGVMLRPLDLVELMLKAKGGKQ
jgi:hypothetical protein